MTVNSPVPPATLLSSKPGNSASPTQPLAAAETRTEGWVAGLQLAALSMRDRSDIPGFIEAFTGSNRFVIDYLCEEVLRRQPDHLRDFLFRTAFLDRLSGPLCEAVTGRSDSSELLQILERDNLFVVPLDDQRRWYRYHRLFADVLRARSSGAGPDHVRTLHRLASDWHERNDLPEDAVRHALGAADFERAADLIERSMPEIRRRRQDATLLGWLRLLPDEVAGRRPVLSAVEADERSNIDRRVCRTRVVEVDETWSAGLVPQDVVRTEVSMDKRGVHRPVEIQYLSHHGSGCTSHAKPVVCCDPLNDVGPRFPSAPRACRRQSRRRYLC